MSLTPKQWFQIISGSISGLITGAALFNPLVGQENALMIVSALGILNIIVSSVGTALSGTDSSVADVKAIATSGNQAAKVALLDATASLPEVRGDIRVSDPALANATVSNQVKVG